MIADLHCHYPMHLLADDDHLHGKWADWFTRVRDDVDAELVDLAARAANDPSWSGGWRVNVPGLVKGHARIVCSVLYWPSDEFQHGSTPAPGSFADLQSLLHFVEDDLTKRGQLVVKCATDLDRAGRMAFVHCVEGGFHLGPDENEIDANVQWLAKQGVLYITLAHLFFKGVATNAPSIPPLSDAVYDAVHQPPGRGLTNLGRAAGPRRSRSPRLATKSGP